MIVTAMVISTFSSAALMISLIASGPTTLINELDTYPKNKHLKDRLSSLRGYSEKRLQVDEEVELENYHPGFQG
ncbi:hypothetical protein BGX29_002273 [Mortierella sp. GBA35]|nr:hypothetical protein BGX29_002273 [Mortierella sp. GBA35]